jgi:predicted small lipoprotein YifL
MKHPIRALLLGGAMAILAACGGGGPVLNAPPPPKPQPPPAQPEFHFHDQAPRAEHLPYDAQDQARPLVSPEGHRDSAAVFVYADRGNRMYVLLGRRGKSLSLPGTWGVFQGSVEETDLDATGRMSFARAAEHELYEESVTVYHDTDANALRACRAYTREYRSGLRTRTFFLRRPYLPESLFNDGYAYAAGHRKPHRFLENDQFRWVLLEDLLACGQAMATFQDVAGVRHPMTLYQPFYDLVHGDHHYRAHLRDLR